MSIRVIVRKSPIYIAPGQIVTPEIRNARLARIRNMEDQIIHTPTTMLVNAISDALDALHDFNPMYILLGLETSGDDTLDAFISAVIILAGGIVITDDCEYDQPWAIHWVRPSFRDVMRVIKAMESHHTMDLRVNLHVEMDGRKTIIEWPMNDVITGTSPKLAKTDVIDQRYFDIILCSEFFVEQ